MRHSRDDHGRIHSQTVAEPSSATGNFLSMAARPVGRRAFMRSCAFTVGGLAVAGGIGETLAACGSQSSTSAAATSSSLGSITYQFSWIKNVEFGGSYIAATKGYYADQRINVSFLAGGPNVSVEPVVVSGKALVATDSPELVAGAVAQGAPLKIIAATFQKSPFGILSLAKAPITSPAGMIGKKIGVQGNNVTIFKAFLHVNGIPADKVTIVPVQFDPSPLVAGSIDGYLAFNFNEPVDLEQKGIKVNFFLMSDYHLGNFSEVYEARSDSLSDKTRRAQLVAFLRGEILGWQGAVADPALAADLAVNDFGKGLGLTVPIETASAIAMSDLIVTPETKQNGILTMSQASIQHSIATMTAEGINVSSDLFTTEILEEAYDGANHLTAS